MQSSDCYKIKFRVNPGGKVKFLTLVHEGWNVPDREDCFRTEALSFREESPL